MHNKLIFMLNLVHKDSLEAELEAKATAKWLFIKNFNIACEWHLNHETLCAEEENQSRERDALLFQVESPLKFEWACVACLFQSLLYFGPKI